MLLQVGMKCLSMRMTFDLLRGSSLHVSQLQVAIQTLWSQCLFHRADWTNRLVVHSQISLFLFDLHLRFRLRLVFIYTFNRHWHTTLAEWRCIHRSYRSWVCAFAAKQDIFSDLLSKQTRWLLAYKSHRPWQKGFWFWLDLLGVFTTSSNIWIQFLHPVICKGSLCRRSRWRI